MTSEATNNNDNTADKKPFVRKLDLNCDLAQGWGAYRHHFEEDSLLPFVTSVNIASGGHAGDPPLIYQSLKLAKQYDLAVGAHVGYPDLAGFGRRDMRMDADELNAYVAAQLGTLAGIADTYGITLTHFRPHGAMYYRCSHDRGFAEQLARAVASFSEWLTFISPACPHLNAVSEASGLRTVGEVHLDRPYKRDGLLQSPNQYKSPSLDAAQSQARSVIQQGLVTVEGGKRLKLPFKTVHLNLDHRHALQLARYARELLGKEGLQPLDSVARPENFHLDDFRLPVNASLLE